MQLGELDPKTERSLTIFDIDDTLMHTTAKIKVVKDGRVVAELTNQEFNHYTLKPGEEFDFGEFRNAEKFNQESKPIKPMVNKLKSILSRARGKVIMLTARADFDDRELFLDTFRKLGIDMSRVHVHRAGNLPGKDAPAEKKAVWVRHYLDTGKFNKVIMYDDSMSNLRVFKSLQKQYPRVKFYAHYVTHTGEHQTIEESTVDNQVLDEVLVKLCDMIYHGQEKDSDYYGMVAAAVVDPKGRIVSGLNHVTKDDKHAHGEYVAIQSYINKHGDIPEGSIVVTTLSPCNEHLDERHGPSCASLINQYKIRQVYCGYIDPTQHKDEYNHFETVETSNPKLRELCKRIADSFLNTVSED